MPKTTYREVRKLDDRFSIYLDDKERGGRYYVAEHGQLHALRSFATIDDAVAYAASVAKA